MAAQKTVVLMVIRKGAAQMQWYLLKTWTGREEELVKEIRRTVPSYMYEDVFVIYTERIWRRQGRSIVHPEPLFHGCVFLTCRESEPIWRRMGQVPFLTQWMAMGYLTVYPLMEKDAEFLQKIAGDEHLMRLSYVLRERDGVSASKRESGKVKDLAQSAANDEFMSINGGRDLGDADDGAEVGAAGSGVRYRVSGPLEYCLENIDSIEFRKRFVKLHKRLWGEDMVIAMGIVLSEDMEQGLVYEGLEVDTEIPDGWTMLKIKKDADGKREYAAGERNYPAEKICPTDGTIYPADGTITLLPENYGKIARVG